MRFHRSSSTLGRLQQHRPTEKSAERLAFVSVLYNVSNTNIVFFPFLKSLNYGNQILPFLFQEESPTAYVLPLEKVSWYWSSHMIEVKPKRY